MSERRIVITGMGVISPIGQDVGTFEKTLFGGGCGIESVGFTYRGNEVRFPAAPVKNFNPEDWIDAKKVSMQDRFSQFAGCRRPAGYSRFRLCRR